MTQISSGRRISRARLRDLYRSCEAISNLCDLVRCHGREERECNCSFTNPFGNRKIPRLKTKLLFIKWLQMNRGKILVTADPVLSQGKKNPIPTRTGKATRQPHHIHKPTQTSLPRDHR